MSAPLTPKHVNIEIAKYINGFINGEYTMPIWQRQECWDSTYRKSLIESIMLGIDLPKLYIGEVPILGKVIIDGGHRTRAIKAYLNNEYPISIGKMMVYYTETKTETRDSRVMSEDEKYHIDTYKLTVCVYGNLNESMARKIFNKLQNAVPMSVPDVVNSFESPLVDTLRDFLDFKINDHTVRDYFTLLKSFPTPENNEDLYQLLSLATICWPTVSSNNQMESLKWIEKGKTSNSKCFLYLKNFDDNFENVTDEMKKELQEFLTIIVTLLHAKNYKFPTADFNTLCHCLKWVRDFDIGKFLEFFETVQEYNGEKASAKKLYTKGQFSVAKEISVKADSVNENYEGKLSEWIGSRTKGGSGEDGMKVRLVIIKQYCLVDNSTEEENEEENEDRNVLENSESIPTVPSV